MSTPLTEEQRELLSAYLDGEVTDAERQTAETLLKRDDAKQYLESLRATAELVMKHASVKAPIGLSGRVMTELQKDIKPKAGKVHTLPAISWQTPLWAAAAVVVLSLAVMFGPSLLNTESKPDSDVARSVLDDLPQGSADGTMSVDPPRGEKPEGTLNDFTSEDTDSFARGGGSGGRTLERFRGSGEAAPGTVDELGAEAAEVEKATEDLGELKELSRRTSRDGQSPSNDAVDGKPEAESTEVPKSGTGKGNWGEKDSTEEASKKPNEQSDREDERENKRKEDGTNAPPPPSQPHDSPDGNGETKKAKDTDKSEGSKAEGTGGDFDDKADPKDYGAPSEKNGLAEEGQNEDGESADDDKNRAEAEPQDRPARDQLHKYGKALEIHIAQGGTLQGQTDVLWISSLYGDASLTDDDADVESVSVEIDQDKLPQLMAALQRLAVDQGYGKVDGGTDVPSSLAGGDAAGEAKISGYLPTDNPAKDADATEPAPEPDPETPAEEPAEAPAKVIVVIRLN